jgi:glycosyltransferase involved in cell wall biosynthesis
MEKILTIAIPTYNRPLQIQTQVRLILPQLYEEVCLVIYDNSSPISVKALFTEDELSQFSIIRNRVNIGGDANIARCFENCTTQWLWTLSDDDYIKTDAVAIVISDIKRNYESVFLNFYSYRNFETVGFEQLTFAFRKAEVFGNSFAMASCVYNMAKLLDSMQDYYNFLSSNVGSIILVLKYVERNDKALCVFTDKTPINIYNSEVGWNYGVYIKRTRLFIEAFGGKNIRKFSKTLFLGCHKVNYSLIMMNRKESKINYWQRWKIFKIALQNQGFLNAIRFMPGLLIFTFLYLLLQHRWLNWILRLFKRFKKNNIDINTN